MKENKSVGLLAYGLQMIWLAVIFLILIGEGKTDVSSLLAGVGLGVTPFLFGRMAGKNGG